MTNKEFSEKDDIFRSACKKVGLLEESRRHFKLGLGRQAGKWKRKKGLAYNKGRELTAPNVNNTN